MLRHQFESERAALARLQGRLSVPVPQIVSEGERSGWPYLIMTRMNGVSGKDAWALLPEDQRESVLTQVGEVIAEVQRVPVGDLSRLQPQWEQFIPKQIEGCRARHERLGLPKKYLDGLDHFLRDAAMLIPVNAAPVILTGEYNPEKIFLQEPSRRWRLAALIDFGDVMTGWGEYDLLGPSTFAAAGMPRRVQSLLRGFEYPKASADPALRRRLMTLLLLIGSAIWQGRYALRAGNRRPPAWMNWDDCSGPFDGGAVCKREHAERAGNPLRGSAHCTCERHPHQAGRCLGQNLN